MNATVITNTELALLQQEHQFNLEIMEGVMNGEKQLLVDAEKLHQELGISTAFTHWVKRRVEDNQFIENADYWHAKIDTPKEGRGGASFKHQYILTLESAKTIGMQENVRIRRYFLAVEKLAIKLATKPIPTFTGDVVEVMEALLIEAKSGRLVIQQQQEVIAELQPKADFHDTVANAEGTHKVSEVAKIFGTSGVKLYEWLRANGFLSSAKSHWNLPYQCWINKGLFVVIEQPYEHPRTGETRLSFSVRVTGHGMIKIKERFNLLAA